MAAGGSGRFSVLIGGVLAALAMIAGHANRQLLDGPTFADHLNGVG